MTVRTHDRVGLPVPELRTVVDLFRPCGNVAFALKSASGILCVVTLSSDLGHDAKVLVESSTFLLVPENELVNGLGTDSEGTIATQDAGDLLRAPVLFDQGHDVGPLLVSELGSTA